MLRLNNHGMTDLRISGVADVRAGWEIRFQIVPTLAKGDSPCALLIGALEATPPYAVVWIIDGLAVIAVLSKRCEMSDRHTFAPSAETHNSPKR